MAEIENLKIGSGGTIHIVGNEDIVAEAWAVGQSYVKDKSYVINNHVLYVCNTTHTSTSPFDPTNWTQITVGESLTSLVDAINEIIATSKLNPVYGNEASGAIATFDTSLALPLQDLQIEINAVQESGTPTPSSPKAISGFTGANIYTRGSNLWDEEWEIGAYDLSTGQKTNANNRIRTKNYIAVLPNTTYFNCCPNIIIALFYDRNKTFLSQYGFNANSTFVTPSNAYYMNFHVATAYGTTYNNDISINYPATDTAYHAYNANSTTTAITWQSEAGTVYGGSLDVTSGVLTVTHKIVNMGDLSYTHYTVTQGELFRASLSDIKQITNQYTAPNALSDIYKTVNTTLRTNYTLSQATNNPSLDFINDDYNDATAFKNAMQTANAKLVYELATPVTYQLTPTQISAIVGTNNVFTDTNGDTSVVYACSLKDYIDSQ